MPPGIVVAVTTAGWGTAANRDVEPEQPAEARLTCQDCVAGGRRRGTNEIIRRTGKVKTAVWRWPALHAGGPGGAVARPDSAHANRVAVSTGGRTRGNIDDGGVTG